MSFTAQKFGCFQSILSENDRYFALQDFEACAKALHNLGYSNPQLTAARGTSAGGLIVGAVCNRSPDLFKAVILKVRLLL